MQRSLHLGYLFLRGFSKLQFFRCNLRLQEMMKLMCADRDGTVCAMDDRYCIDNGAMIAQAGLCAYNSGVRENIKNCTITQRYRTDEVEVLWRND